MANFLTVAAKHCRQAEHSPQLAAGSFNTFLFLMVVTLCSACVIFFSSSSHASEIEERTWSLRFNNVAVGDMLKQLSRATGVEISTNKTPNTERITRSYEDQTIEHIIRDALRGTNYTLVWHYGENQLESVGICFYDAGGGTSSKLSTNRNTGSNNPIARGGSTQRPPRYRTQVSQPKRPPVPRNLAASKSKSRTAAKERTDEDDEPEDEDEMDEEDE
jgi:hypothetical protein